MTEHHLQTRTQPGEPEDQGAAELAEWARSLHPDAVHQQTHQSIVTDAAVEDVNGLPAGTIRRTRPAVSGSATYPPTGRRWDEGELHNDTEGTWND